MSSIALFQFLFTNEEEIRDTLAAVSGYNIIRDGELVDMVAQQHGISKEKIERALHGPTSVFNKFTLERNRITLQLQQLIAEKLNESGWIFTGFTAHLIPAKVTHVLRVGISDEKINRIRRAIAEGLTEKRALKLIRKNDRDATDWTNFLYAKSAGDPTLYDIFQPLSDLSTKAVVQLIMENYHKPAVLESEASRQAVKDFSTEVCVGSALVDKGYTPDIQCTNGKVTLLINKSVMNFSKLSDTLTSITKTVPGVKEVEVTTGKDYTISVYRDQDFVLPPKVLLVDDEQEFVQTLSDRLNTRNYGSYPVFDGEQALDFLGSETPDVMVLDLKMPGMDGIEVLRRTKKANPGIEIIVLTGHGSEEDREACMKLGAYAYLHKPVDITQLTSLIDEAHKKVAAKRLAATRV